MDVSNRSHSQDAATSSLQLLLREDPLLEKHRLTTDESEAPLAYAAALLQTQDANRAVAADRALQNVERKLTLVTSLTTRVSREQPVAEGLLRMYGYTEGATPSQMGDRAVRLQRQTGTLQSVTNRVETTLLKSQSRMELACQKLERVLALQATLKRLLTWQFEAAKLQNYVIADVHELQKAAASVSVVTELMESFDEDTTLQAVQDLRGPTRRRCRAVREAAEALPTTPSRLPTTLQVFYHLGELPSAVWKVVDEASLTIEQSNKQLLQVALPDLYKQQKNKQLQTKAVEDWTAGWSEAMTTARHLQKVIQRKKDPVERVRYIDVVASAPVPDGYQTTDGSFSLWNSFWKRACEFLATDSQTVTDTKYKDTVAALYPLLRVSLLELVSQALETTNVVEEATDSAPSVGILGGSAMIDNPLGDNLPADTWTSATATVDSAIPMASTTSLAARSVIFSSQEWKELQANGLDPLEQVFLAKCHERLQAPLSYMFPADTVTPLDDEGVVMASGVTMLPSKYDIQRFDENIRQVLASANPREGGGDLSSVTMIAECIVDTIGDFCDRAKGALNPNGAKDGYIDGRWTMKESLQHDRKVVAILFTLSNYLKNAPDKVFVTPYRPTSLPQHEEAARLCKEALLPALEAIDKVSFATVVNPAVYAMNREMSLVLGQIHQGVYLSASQDDTPSFVQKVVAPVLESISKNILSKFPPPYASKMVASFAAYTIYAFVSNISLVRPLEEAARLQITQDLADLEMSLEQFASGKGDIKLGQIDGGKPYAELRAVRQMLFWSGLESESSTASDIAKSLLREAWLQDVRPSTIFHYLFSFAPILLSSPHHMKRQSVTEYVGSLIKVNGVVEEDDAWMTIVSCCDAYQQRASSSASQNGDPRVAAIVLAFGQELQRRRGI